MQTLQNPANRSAIVYPKRDSQQGSLVSLNFKRQDRGLSETTWLEFSRAFDKQKRMQRMAAKALRNRRNREA